MTDKKKVLVKEKLAPEGVEYLRSERASRSTSAPTWRRRSSGRGSRDYDGLIIRSATKVTAEVIEAGKNLKVVGRAGVGVDNVDVDAATKRGIIVVNAPASNVLSAAEHTIGLMMACARNIPQAHGAQGRTWDRSKYGGVELPARRSASSASAASAFSSPSAPAASR